MRQALTRCIWTPELSGELGAISSTSLRRRAAQQPVYALRGDLDWSAQHWSWNWGQGQTCGRVTLPMALREFEAGLLDALKRALPDVAFVVTQQVGGPARAQEIARRLERPVVSMDVSAHGSEPGLNLSSSRVFELGGEQRRGLRPAPRPGHPSLQDQAARITRQLAGRPYVLLDDDVASGQTMTWAQSLLRAAGAVGEARQATLMSRALSDAGYSGAQAMDVCDLRDFLLGSREGGLVVELNGPDALGRAVYAAPWVNLSARASIPQERQHRLSQEIWALNERFHAHSGLQVIDADLACQALLLDQGFGLQAPLAQVAREMRTRCS